jgi:hypothetical protein
MTNKHLKWPALTLVSQFSSWTPFRVHAAFTYVNAVRKCGPSAQVNQSLIKGQCGSIIMNWVKVLLCFVPRCSCNFCFLTSLSRSVEMHRELRWQYALFFANRISLLCIDVKRHDAIWSIWWQKGDVWSEMPYPGSLMKFNLTPEPMPCNSLLNGGSTVVPILTLKLWGGKIRISAPPVQGIYK